MTEKICTLCMLYAKLSLRNPAVRLLAAIFDEYPEIHLASLIVGTEPGDCQGCREDDGMGRTEIVLCECCLERVQKQPNLCPHGVKMRMSEPVEIK